MFITYITYYSTTLIYYMFINLFTDFTSNTPNKCDTYKRGD